MVSWWLGPELLQEAAAESVSVAVKLSPALHRTPLSCKAASPLLATPLEATVTIQVQCESRRL